MSSSPTNPFAPTWAFPPGLPSSPVTDQVTGPDEVAGVDGASAVDEVVAVAAMDSNKPDGDAQVIDGTANEGTIDETTIDEVNVTEVGAVTPVTATDAEEPAETVTETGDTIADTAGGPSTGREDASVGTAASSVAETATDDGSVADGDDAGSVADSDTASEVTVVGIEDGAAEEAAVVDQLSSYDLMSENPELFTYRVDEGYQHRDGRMVIFCVEGVDINVHVKALDSAAGLRQMFAHRLLENVTGRVSLEEDGLPEWKILLIALYGHPVTTLGHGAYAAGDYVRALKLADMYLVDDNVYHRIVNFLANHMAGFAHWKAIPCNRLTDDLHAGIIEQLHYAHHEYSTLVRANGPRPFPVFAFPLAIKLFCPPEALLQYFTRLDADFLKWYAHVSIRVDGKWILNNDEVRLFTPTA
ncbi:Uu.00g013490.m01.CDS01 [Anthostomella pinea]|uniref:Uu.00g013490.m01.CDS01 n=1 Tax=Anthostomella pinea TaxID=933095 RepID=A0AAI8VZ21_9PEZI|nr:Uu.00g013490.m01.CDS01 [Anthostomella pinea]